MRVRLARDPKGPLRFRCGAVERALPPAGSWSSSRRRPADCCRFSKARRNGVLFELGVNFLDESEADLRDRTTADAGRLT